MLTGSEDINNSLTTPLLNDVEQSENKRITVELSSVQSYELSQNLTLPGALAAQPEHVQFPEASSANPLANLEDQSVIAVTEFLNSLGIDPKNVAADREFISTLNQLLSVEQNPYRSNLRWANVDSIIERLILTGVLSQQAVRNNFHPNAASQISIGLLNGRSIPLRQPFARQMVLAIRNFIRGAELTVFDAIHYFFYGLLSYHFYQLFSTGRSDFSDLRAALFSTTDNGLVNLVRGLAQLPPALLKGLLGIAVVPTVALTLRGFLQKKLWDKDDAGVERFIQETLPRDLNIFLYTECWQWLPIIPSSSGLQNLERLVRWHGHLSEKSLEDLVSTLEHLAKTSHKYIQRTAMISLAKLVHSFHAKDLLHLKVIHSPKQLSHYLKLKQQALTTLQTLSHFKVEGSKKEQAKQYATQAIRVLYANYLLWWLGFSPSIMASLFFTATKGLKLGLEINLLINLIKTIQDVLICPQPPDFVFGEGIVQQWAGDFTAQCFTARLNLFRQLNPNESVEGLIQELQQYHLNGLSALDLRHKYLKNDDVIKLLAAVVQRGAQVTDLDLSKNSLAEVTAELFTHLPQLRQVDLRQQVNLTTVTPNAFANLQQLLWIDLTLNQLTTVPSGAFTNLPQLQWVGLTLNQLTTVPSGAFTNLPQLQTLYFAGNQLTAVASDAFTNLPLLQTLYLNVNTLTTVPSDAFTNLTQLQTLDLGVNPLTTVPSDAFTNLPQLQTLYLRNNQLTTVPSGAFTDLTQLKTLDLSGNLLTVITLDAFTNMPQLQALDLSWNQLTMVSSGAFTKLPQLQILTLDNNPLTTVASDAFTNLPLLQKLDLVNNQLTTVPSGAFTNMPNLQALDLSGNNLTTVPSGAFANLPQLQTLDLGSGNQLTTVASDAFTNLPLLLTLSLSGNLLTTLPSDAFTKLPQLQTLDLSANQFATVPSNVFTNLPQLKQLALDNNRLTTVIADAFIDLPQLQTLSLFGNQLTKVSSDAFAGLQQLKSLYLDYNRLTTVPSEAFTNLPKLQSLGLGSNRLSTLPSDAFTNLPKLQSLRLSGNQLSTLLSGAFTNLPQLQTLFLDSNRLITLPSDAFANLPQLQTLYLRNNQLTTVPSGAFTNLPQLQTLDLHYNQLTTVFSGAFTNMPQLQTLDFSSNNISMIAKDAFVQVNLRGGTLSFQNQHLNDEAVYNLTQCLPAGVATLDLSNNHITSAGLETLASILPCTNITSLNLTGNPANASLLNLKTQANLLRQQCEAQRCHDVWPDQICEVLPPPNVNVSVTNKQETENSFANQRFYSWSWTWFKGFVDSTITKAHTLIQRYYNTEDNLQVEKDKIQHGNSNREDLSTNILSQGFNDAAGDDLALQAFQKYAYSMPEFLSGKDSSTTQHDMAHADKVVTSSTINSYQLITNALPHSDMVLRAVDNNANNFTAASTNNNAQIIASALVAGAAALVTMGICFFRRDRMQSSNTLIQSDNHFTQRKIQPASHLTL